MGVDAVLHSLNDPMAIGVGPNKGTKRDIGSGNCLGLDRDIKLEAG